MGLVVPGVASQPSVEEIEATIGKPNFNERTPVEYTDSEVQPGPRRLTPMGLFDAESYPETCFPTKENFYIRYSRRIHILWDMGVSDFLVLTADFDWVPWDRMLVTLSQAAQDYGNGITVGEALSYPGDASFEERLRNVWEKPDVQSLYKRHMEIVEISTWTATVQYQGDIDYVATLNDDMLNHIAWLIWDNDPILSLLYAVQKYAEE
jgi:hypothetical protein